MIRIVNSAGRALEPVPGQTITIEKHNPLFNDADSFFSDISYPFKAGLNENNKAFFGLGHMLESSNSLYRIDVQFYAEEILMVTGKISYRISPDGFECTLEPNQTAINYLMKNVHLSDIRTLDSDLTSGDTEAKLNALMLNTCQFPQNYNYIFLPIQNPNIGQAGVSSRGAINYYNLDAQAFESGKPSTPYSLANTPFFKLTYILKNVAQYLGLTPDGDFFTDPYYDAIYIYTRMAFETGFIYPSMRYMPYMLISDFLKQLRERYYLAIDINLSTAKMTVSTFRNIKKGTKITDLTPYITNVIEHELPESKGYTVSLKADEQDNAFNIGTDDNKTFAPLKYLIVNDGSNKVEKAAGALKFIEQTAPGLFSYLTVDQYMKIPTLPLDDYPSEFQQDDPLNINSGNKWPLRFFRYTGMVDVGGGKFYPTAASEDLKQDDIDYYRFLNDSKQITLHAVIPPYVLAEMPMTDKYCFKTEDGNYVYIIIDQVAYDKRENEELTATKIYCRVLNYDLVTKAEIIGNDATLSENNRVKLFRFKAFFDVDKNGFNELPIEIYVGAPGSGYTVTLPNIITPTTYKGTGGSVVSLYERQAHLQTLFELRISTGQPQYMEYLGQRFYFTYDTAGYYKATLTLDNYPLDDFYWIKF
ncbi:hypothetical protein GCM10023149_54130 [Mucilaginibacter gynuensis]|uniref:Uncharacterized protein n=1 Tax=Mucilaginibacter gynuensis TaxID=1302236 RepID=A0ABP8HN28_9SPHI